MMSKTANPSLSAAVLRRAFGRSKPCLGLVLGSGFKDLERDIQVSAAFDFTALPGFPRPTVKGHAGKVLCGTMHGVPVVVMSGRAHYYEGHSMRAVTFPIRVLAACGIQDVLLTNASGGINRRFRPGDLMVVTDHINLMPENPLRGTTEQPLFIDLCEAYSLRLRRMLKDASRKARVSLRSGVYMAVAGPNYETPAEIRAFAALGADAVGMSTVPEVLVARQLGLSVAALSCIANAAAGQGQDNISHTDVLATGKKAADRARRLIKSFFHLYEQSH